MLCVRNECGWCLKREVTYLTEPLEGPVITVLSFLERSREPHRSFGAVCAGAVDVSIASGEATDNVFVVGFVVTDGALRGDAGRKIAFFAKISTFEILLLKSLLIIQLSFPQRS